MSVISIRRGLVLVAIMAAITAQAFALSAAPAQAAPTWAPAATATIHPGVQTVTNGGQCTANFVFFDGANNIYLGQAAHCSSTGAQTSTNGCNTESLPEGTQVAVSGASQPGVMVYNSWVRMQDTDETDAEACAYNDLALIKINSADAGKVNPSVPFFGGPTGIGTASALQRVFSYQNSSLRLGLEILSPKFGTVLSRTPGGWSYTVLTITPGIPGDSGSGFLNRGGRAMGVLSTLALAPLPASNGVGDMGRELAYAQTHGFGGLQVATGTEPFNPPL